MALRWLVQGGHPFTTASMSEAYDAEDMSVFDFKLTDAEMASLGEVKSDDLEPRAL